jgi:YidC/Oxa1 family membrane protein insertase
VSESISFAGVDNSYFLAVLIPEDAEDFERARAHVIHDSDYLENVIEKRPNSNATEADKLFEAARNIGVSLAVDETTLAPEGTETWKLDFFVGPKDRDILAHYPGLDNLINLGALLRPLSLIFLYFLNAFHKLIPNYGVAIIFLTIIIRVLLHPLTKKSQRSMHKMQKMQPKLKEVQAKYKGDKQRLGQEQMKLMREHGVSPFGGCLTGMIVQIPVFFALFRMLRASIELRQAPFLWIKDLSQPDVVFELPFMLPLLKTNVVSLLPILMIASMIVSQHFMPKAVDPQAKQQQKFMKFMPLIFGFIFYTFPSGLVLYWLTSNLLQIGEQYIIRRELAAEEEDQTGGPAAQKTKSSSKKSGKKKAQTKSGAKRKNDLFSKLFSR